MKKNPSESLMRIVFFFAACVSILAVILICVFIFAGAFPAIREIGLFRFVSGTRWSPSSEPPSFGILPMIVGSFYVTAGAAVLGLPIGLLTAIFMARFCPEGVYKYAKPVVELLSGIPSIIYGFFGLVVLVPFVREHFGGNGSSVLTASLILAVMILPTIIGISEAAIRAVPESYYEGALALGATHERAVMFAAVPAAKSGILASVVLGIGRAIGETMAVSMVVGNQAWIPDSILKGVRTMTTNIVLEMGYAADLHRSALIATGAVLFIFILAINLLLSAVKARTKA